MEITRLIERCRQGDADALRIYFNLCIIKYFLNIISPNNDMKAKVDALLAAIAVGTGTWGIAAVIPKYLSLRLRTKYDLTDEEIQILRSCGSKRQS